MSIFLGIDTGGTYTDAVLFSEESGVIRSAKALTTKHDLSLGIREAVEAALPSPAPDIHLVSLSTTLATNAIVEGQGNPICLLLVGYPPDSLDQDGLRAALGRDPVVFIDGGHLVSGEEQTSLDIDAAREAIRAHAPEVAAFAVSGYFAVRNPAHEIALRALIREMTGLPVTCGHELTSNLHAPRRALTTALNARLISLLQQLILAVRGMLEEKRIHAPLMVVKGDGSLVDARVALERPVETILSGPAASVVGARHLTGEEDVFVVDMGGTTTDIALLRGGRPVLNVEGALIGGWRTMVEAVSVHTFGLGGDSEVRFEERGRLVLGPRRVVPLSLLAHQHPVVLDALRAQAEQEEAAPTDGRFVMRLRCPPSPPQGWGGEETPFPPQSWGGEGGHLRASLTSAQAEVWDRLAEGPVALADLLRGAAIPLFREWAVTELAERGLAIVSGFTPTDAAHVLGRQSHWSVEAARLGALLWTRQHAEAAGGPPCPPNTGGGRETGGPPCPPNTGGGRETDAPPGPPNFGGGRETGAPPGPPNFGGEGGAAEEFSERVMQALVVQAGRALITSAFAEDGASQVCADEKACRVFLDRALTGDGAESLVDISVGLRRPLVAVGAPVATFYPTVAERLHTRLHIPEHAGIANAVGAVAGGVMQSVRALVKPTDTGYRVHLPTGIHDFAGREEAAEFAAGEVSALAEAQARRAGAAEVQVKVRCDDHVGHSREGEVYLDTEVIAMAFGRPRLADSP